MTFAEDTVAVMEGELSYRAVFTDLGADIRGVFDRYSAEFRATENGGMAVVGDSCSLGVAFSKVKDIFSSIKGSVVRIYDPEGIGDDEAYAEFRCGLPQKFENLTAEIPLEALT